MRRTALIVGLTLVSVALVVAITVVSGVARLGEDLELR
jgi:hypothetical protein